MLQLIRIIILTSLPLFSVFAQENAIRAIVNHQTITTDELLIRKLLMRTLNGVGQLSDSEEKQFTQSILQTMVQDLITHQAAIRSGVSATTPEINDYIALIEKNNGMPANYMKDNLPADLYEDFVRKMRDGMLKNKLVQQVIMPTIKISRQTTDEMAILAAGKDAEITMYIAETDGTTKEHLKQIQQLRNKLFSLKCFDPQNSVSYSAFNKINMKLSTLPVKHKSLTRDLEVGQVSSIIKEGKKLQVLKLCARKLFEYDKVEQKKILSLVGNQKLQLQAERYLKALYKRSYVEIK